MSIPPRSEPSRARGAPASRRAGRPRTIQRLAVREAAKVPAGGGAPPASEGAEAILAAAVPEPPERRARRLPALLPERRVRPIGRRERAAKPPSLLQNERFRIFWLSRLAVQTAQGAMVYAFLLIVADQSDRATYNSVFVICSIIPAILFGLPAGLVGDAVPRRPLLIALNVARFLLAVVLVRVEPSLVGILAATLAIWTVFQFYAPSENATLSALVPRHRLAAGQALYNLAATLSQLLGLVILAPLLLKTAGPQTLFAVCGALFFVATGLVALLPRLDEHIGASPEPLPLRATLLDGWRGVRADGVTLRALSCDVLIGIGMSSLVVIVPLYLKRVLDTPAENTVFVFAPAALGLVCGLRFAPAIAARLGPQRVATAGLLGFALCVAALGFVQDLRHGVADGLQLPLDQLADSVRIPSLVLVTMLVSIPAGFFSAVVSVTARSLLLGRTPPSRRGQTIATTTLLTNVGALAPTLLAGVATDLFGVERVAVAIAVALSLGGVAAWTVLRPLPLSPPPSPSRAT